MCKVKVCCLLFPIHSWTKCRNRLVPLIDPKDQKLSSKLRHLVERLVPSSFTYTSSGRIFICTYLAPKMMVIPVGDPLCTIIAKEAFIRELKEMKKGNSERMTYIQNQKDILRARKRVGSP